CDRHSPRAHRTGLRPHRHWRRGCADGPGLGHVRRAEPVMSAPAPGRQTGSFGDELTNAAMIGLIGGFALALPLRGAGAVAAFGTGSAQPAAGAAAGVGVLFNPGDPATALEAEGLNVGAYWIVVAVLLALLAVAIAWVWTLLRRQSRTRATDPHRLVGIATK